MKPIRSLMLIVAFFVAQISIAQNSFSVKKTGKGNQHVIFLPGFASSGAVWDETVEVFASEYTCHVITFSGFAGEKPQPDPNLSLWVIDLAEYIKNSKIEKPILVGHSLGGILATWLAADYPALISKVVIVDALPSLSALYNPAFKVQLAPDCAPVISQFVSMNDEQFYAMQKNSMQMMVANQSKVESVINWSVKSDRKTMGQIYCQFLNTDLRNKLQLVKCEVLVMLEPAFKQMDSSIQEQYSGLPTKTIKYAARGLHFIMFDDTDWFQKELKNFLKNGI